MAMIGFQAMDIVSALGPMDATWAAGAPRTHDAILMSFGVFATPVLNQLRYDLRKMRAHELFERRYVLRYVSPTGQSKS
jgi:hypothetical protein